MKTQQAGVPTLKTVSFFGQCLQGLPVSSPRPQILRCLTAGSLTEVVVVDRFYIALFSAGSQSNFNADVQFTRIKPSDEAQLLPVYFNEIAGLPRRIRRISVPETSKRLVNAVETNAWFPQ